MVIYKIEREYIPVKLLEVGCVEIMAEDTVRSLAIAYLETRGCLRAYVKLIDGIKKNYTEPVSNSKEIK